LPDFGKLHPHHDPDEIYALAPYTQRLRRVIRLERRPSRRGVATTVGVFVLAGARLHPCAKAVFSRFRRRPNYSSSCACRRASAIGASLEAAKQAEAALKGDSDAAYYRVILALGRPRFWLGMNPTLPERPIGIVIVVAKDEEARERAEQKAGRAALAAGALAQARARRRPLQFRGRPVGFASGSSG